MTLSVVLHGHFYQPPRESPWTGRIPEQPEAAPFHDWNERIASECYEPLARLGAFEHLSFDVGPTLLAWLERERPSVYGAVLAGDRNSRERLGCGNALAQPYHHVILPLASDAERETEVRWGIADFERRFGRRPEGMWLPETAVDLPTLETLARNGIAFTVLAPHQVERPPVDGGPGIVRLEGGREIAVFVYDGELSHGVAFGALLRDPDVWLARLEAGAGAPTRSRAHARAGSPAGGGMEPRGDAGERTADERREPLVSLATDGETFGHHHAGADEVLAEVLRRIEDSPRLRSENFASALSSRGHGPELRLIERTSWSCAHGIERWRSDCGCVMAPEREWRQTWRAPLRRGLDDLAEGLDALWEAHAGRAFADPAGARSRFGDVVGADPAARAAVAGAAARPDDPEAAERAVILLELLRDRHAMFTSCGWFFDDVAGLEPEQVLRHAAHALDLAARLDPGRAARLEERLLERLAEAPSNDPDVGEAAALYRRRIRAAHPFPGRTSTGGSDDPAS